MQGITVVVAEPKFNLGQIVATPGALELLSDDPHTGAAYIRRHVTGDWGVLDDEDKQENDFSVENGFRILSAYMVGTRKLWVITEADRSVTTLLLPEEY